MLFQASQSVITIFIFIAINKTKIILKKLKMCFHCPKNTGRKLSKDLQLKKAKVPVVSGKPTET